MSKQAISKNLWAPKATPKRGAPWIIWSFVRMTRRDAKSAYLEGIEPECQKDCLDRVKFVRVTITEDHP